MKTNSNYISSKLPQIGTSIFAVMSQLANEHKAINLSQGFPDFNCSEKLQELVNQSIKKGYNQYAPMPGIMPLREAIAEKTHTCFNVSYNPETEITVTAGATQAIYTAISAFIKEGDEVIVFEPAYDCYVPAILMNGGTPKYGKLNFLDYSINWDETRKLISQRTRMIIINSPHNPTGSVL
ncbi:MAG TPA: aminotransferase class I/II-fold pyridoxal phosphate-dependent enzyme, partial [Bacteroidales bacterium]|nr:aminotransferase class I/II-fold pyridoxal phosphate-dependent enzyme [Bacteroidales bacterium]